MLNICISFDYELFLGENYASEDTILFQPTGRIIEVLRDSAVAATFFADVCSVFQYEKFGLDGYVRSFKNQLAEMNQSGQDVQLHIHPNWLRTSRQDDKWHFDVDSYKIHAFGFEAEDEISAPQIIKKGKSFLIDTIKPFDADYQCIAYRAGGLCIQPEQQLFACLVENGIRIDSSVAPRLVAAKNDVPDYDFSRVPRKMNWWVNPPYHIEKDDRARTPESIFEVPVFTVRSNVFKMLTTPMSQLRLPYHKPQGSFITNEGQRANLLVEIAKRIQRVAFGYGILSLDTRSYHLLNENMNYLYHKHNCSASDQYISIICHPKIMNEDGLANLKKFIEIIKAQEDKFKFVSMRDIYDAVVLGLKGN